MSITSPALSLDSVGMALTGKIGLLAASSAQFPWITWTSLDSGKSSIFELERPSSPTLALDLLADGSTVVATDGERVFAIPFDLSVLSLSGSSLDDEVKRKLQGDRQAAERLKECCLPQPLD